MKSTEGLHEMDEEALAESMKECLHGKRYLIVLDDVWSPNVWKDIKVAFPDNMNGSRILVTSRVSEVASSASRSPPYMLPALSKDDAWLLLSKKAFRGDVCPKELEEDGRKIVDKCKCLPLALVVVGGLLATKEKSTRVWSDVADNLRWYLNQNVEDCLDILALSYDELPPHLKICFLYFGVFPEDFEISSRQLIRLWVAEEFIITKDGSRKLEDIAEIYMENLIDRNLIMVARRRSDGGVKSCIIHDLLRDLCISKGVKENFFDVHYNTTTTITTGKPRRLSIHCNFSSFFSPLRCDPSLIRTLICFGDRETPGDSTVRALCKRLRMLRVLDLGPSVVLDSISSEIDQLIHLRYLRINSGKFTKIPSCIYDLPNLQTLDLRESSIKYFGNLWKMQQLRHLFFNGDCHFFKMPDESDMMPMPNLQTLSTVSSNVAYLVDGDAIFPNLKKLGLRASKSSMYTNTELSKVNYKSVERLKIVDWSHLLCLPGGLSSNLTKLTLIQTKIRFPVLEMLAKLPNLQILKLLMNSLAEVRIECGNGWFPKLQVFHMTGLDLEEWNFEGAIPAELVRVEHNLLRQKSSRPVQMSKEDCERLGHWSDFEAWCNWERDTERMEQEVRDTRNSCPVPEAMLTLRYLSISYCTSLEKFPWTQLIKLNTLRHVKISWCNSFLENGLREFGDDFDYEIQK